jgi:hypothetical protein
MRLSRGLGAVAALAAAAALAAPAALGGVKTGTPSCTFGFAGGVLTLTCATSTGTYTCQATRLAFGSFAVTCVNGDQTVLSCSATLFPRLSVNCPIKP